MNEKQRAIRLAHALDIRNSNPQASAEPVDPRDRPLLELAGALLTRAPFAPTPTEQARLRRRLNHYIASQKFSRPAPAHFLTALRRVFRPALQTTLWAALLLGVFILTAMLISNLLGQPTAAGPGPTSTPPPPTPTVSTASPSPEPSLPLLQPSGSPIRVELRELVTLGGSLRATLCYQPPAVAEWGAWWLEGVDLNTGADSLPFYPSSTARAAPGADGLSCETFTTAIPAAVNTTAWTITARRLIAPRETMFDCALVNQQLARDFPGISVTCETTGSGFGFSLNPLPVGIDMGTAQRVASTYFESDVHTGPWTFPVHPSDFTPLLPDNLPANPVVVPSACDPHASLLSDPRLPAYLPFHPKPTGIAGAGTLQSGQFTFQLALACDPNFSRLKIASDERSEINGLGVLWSFTYQGQPVSGGAQHYSGISPFIMRAGGGGQLDASMSYGGYEGFLFPDHIRPDFTQSDVRLRYLVKVSPSGGDIEGAALVFTLRREPEGYRPVDVVVEPLTEAERQSAELNPNAPFETLPFPTLPAPQVQVPSETQSLLDLLDRWQQPLLASPGWVHLRTRTEMPGGSDLFAGLTEYTNDEWFEIDQHGLVVTNIHIDRRPDGTALQQVYSHNEKTVNLTFGNQGAPAFGFQPFLLDLAYPPRAALKKGTHFKREHTTFQGRSAILLIFPGAITSREAIDALSGAWLYSETVQIKEGDDPLTGGTLESRVTIEAAERVDAPPQEALALLGKEFTGYTPPAPYGTPAPEGFDPSRSKLTMQTMHADSFPGSSTWYGDLYADGYLLGRVDFGSIPGGSCVRSADGSRLAFIHTLVGANGSVTSSSLRWFDLRALDVIHQPAPGIVNIGVLSWSPTQETLAVFGCKANQQDCGLYLFVPPSSNPAAGAPAAGNPAAGIPAAGIPAAGSTRLLLPGVYTNWPPIWSPDGSQVAFVDNLKEGSALYVFDILTGQVTYQGKFDANAWQVPPDSPTTAWGVTFPRGSAGSSCFVRD